jgi:hypothetical protein
MMSTAGAHPSPVWALNVAAITNGHMDGPAIVKLVVVHGVGALVLQGSSDHGP